MICYHIVRLLGRPNLSHHHIFYFVKQYDDLLVLADVSSIGRSEVDAGGVILKKSDPTAVDACSLIVVY